MQRQAEALAAVCGLRLGNTWPNVQRLSSRSRSVIDCGCFDLSVLSVLERMNYLPLLNGIFGCPTNLLEIKEMVSDNVPYVM